MSAGTCNTPHCYSNELGQRGLVDGAKDRPDLCLVEKDLQRVKGQTTISCTASAPYSNVLTVTGGDAV
jgi:hypothetical protein